MTARDGSTALVYLELQLLGAVHGHPSEVREVGRHRWGEPQRLRHYMIQPLVELYGGFMVVLKVS
jgi:hypothetical protein